MGKRRHLPAEYARIYGSKMIRFYISLPLKVFIGNIDRNTVVRNTLPVPAVCRYVRLVPITYRTYVSLRMELYGYGPLTGIEQTNAACYAIRIDVRMIELL